MKNKNAIILYEALPNYFNKIKNSFKEEYFYILYIVEELEWFFCLDIITKTRMKVKYIFSSNYSFNNIDFSIDYFDNNFESWIKSFSISHLNDQNKKNITNHLKEIKKNISIFKIPNSYFNSVLEKFYLLGKLLYLLDKKLYFYFFYIKIPHKISYWFDENYNKDNINQDINRDDINKKVNEEIKIIREKIKNKINYNLISLPHILTDLDSREISVNWEIFLNLFFDKLYKFDISFKNYSFPLDEKEFMIGKHYKRLSLNEKEITSFLPKAPFNLDDFMKNPKTEKNFFNISKYNKIINDLSRELKSISGITDKKTKIENSEGKKIISSPLKDFREIIEKDNEEIITIINDIFLFFRKEYDLSINIGDNKGVKEFINRLLIIAINNLWTENKEFNYFLQNNLVNLGNLIQSSGKYKYTDNLRLLSLLYQMFFFSENYFFTQHFYAKIILPKEYSSEAWLSRDFDSFCKTVIYSVKENNGLIEDFENKKGGLVKKLEEFRKNQEDAYLFLKGVNNFYEPQKDSLITLNLSKKNFDKPETDGVNYNDESSWEYKYNQKQNNNSSLLDNLNTNILNTLGINEINDIQNENNNIQIQIHFAFPFHQFSTTWKSTWLIFLFIFLIITHFFSKKYIEKKMKNINNDKKNKKLYIA